MERITQEFIRTVIYILNKRSAYGLHFISRPLAMCCLLLPLLTKAQDTLQAVEITAQKSSLAQIGKKKEVIDSTLKAQFKFNSVGDALSFNSPVFIKSYGPGAIATTAFRGGNASQTAVLWNGFNLQNAMLGQADLALMPAILFENIGVEYGGSSSLWGSGAVGGSIHLDNESRFGKGLITSTNLGGGSFGLRNASAQILVSKQRFVSSTKAYISDAQNTFDYKDAGDPEHATKQQKHAAYRFKGLMQEFKFLINARQVFSVNAWLNSNFRQLPGVDAAISKAYQQDDAARITASWSYHKMNFRSTARAGLFYDRINYTDSLANLFSDSKVRTVMAESENYFTWRKSNQLNIGVNVTSSSATADNYTATRTLSRASLLAGNKFSFFHEKFTAYIAARAEYFSVGTLPVTGNVSLEYRLFKNISLLANAARVYRQPTLNELYWVPGGNIHLKPEQGYSYEGTISYKKQIRVVSLAVSGSAYSRQIQNWILWVPGVNGNPSPVNIQQVWSRGAETSWKINYRKKKWQLGAAIITGYVISTTQASSQEDKSTVGKQLIYTPRYTLNGNIFAGYGGFNLVIFNQYIGYRFTTGDASEWLEPYSVSSLRLNYTLDLKKIKLIFYAASNNLFNANYAIIANRPMPLRNYEFGITIQTKNKNQ